MPDEDATPVTEAIQAAEQLEQSAPSRRSRGTAARAAAREYHYVGHGPQPGDRSFITVRDASGDRRTVQGGGTPVELTDDQHAAFVREGHIFEEDIQTTEGG